MADLHASVVAATDPAFSTLQLLQPATWLADATHAHIAVLDSSFNPPTTAHASIAWSTFPPPLSSADAAATESSGPGPYTARLLLFSARNVDKTLKPGDPTPTQRAEMMLLMAQSAPAAEPTAVGVLNVATFAGKSRVIHEWLAQHRPGLKATLTFLIGTDTLARFFVPRYYTDMDAELRGLFDEDGSHIVCARRGGSVGRQVEAEVLERADVKQWVTQGKLRLLGSGDEGWETVSSTQVREAVQAGKGLDGLCEGTIEQYIRAHRLYGTKPEANAAASSSTPVPSEVEFALLEPATTTRTASLPSLIALTVACDFQAVLTSPEARAMLPSLAADLLPSSTASQKPIKGQQADDITQLTIAVALLHAFVQANWTGPNLAFTTADVLEAGQNDDINAAALPHLTLAGEPAYHLSAEPALFLLSTRILKSLQSSSLPSVHWWRLRAHMVHLSLLDEPVALEPATLDALNALASKLGDSDRAASLLLELGMLNHRLGYDKAANRAFISAARASGLAYELTGALGKRTKYQVAAHSQLVLLAESRRRDGDDDAVVAADATGPAAAPENLPLNDDTLLETTEFTQQVSTERPLDPAAQPPLHPLDQTILLSLCVAQQNSAPSHGLTASQMMPFVTRVLAHPRNWSVYTAALLLRSRLEATRTRTVERSTLQLAALIEQMPTTDSSLPERLGYFHQLPLPAKWEMERELAKRYLSLGVVRSALDIFTRLEMWDEAIGCLQRMEREREAERIVHDLLEGRKVESDLVPVLGRAETDPRRQKLTAAREGKLWCLLGDLHLSIDGARDPATAQQKAIENYEKAWRVSRGTSSRAMRSLGSLYVSSGQYDAAVTALRRALEINPQYARAWFTLGTCLLRLERWDEARDAFRRNVAVDEEDSEGWNNLAAVYLRQGDAMGPVSLENKLMAFRALRSGLRTAYNNWRMWQNYMIVAIDVGELAEAARGASRVAAEVSDPLLAVDPDVLDKLVDGVTRDDWNDGKGPYDGRPPPTSNEGWGLLPIVDRLFGEILERFSELPRVWRAHARLLRWKEDWKGATEDYLRSYRSSVAADDRVERDLERWREAVRDIEELVDVLSVLGPKAKAAGAAGSDWRFQAKGIVRTFMGRTRQTFEDQPEWARLQELLDDLKRSDA